MRNQPNELSQSKPSNQDLDHPHENHGGKKIADTMLGHQGNAHHGQSAGSA